MPFLFDDVIFGPVRSRRLGLSLGINLLPTHIKDCTFNCIYCECGWTPVSGRVHDEFPSREEVAVYLERRLKELAATDHLPDALTFAGNGEPTIHPDFPGIVDEVIRLRNLYAPEARVTVLSNASMLRDPAVFNALLKLDNNILKLDAGTEQMFNLINRPVNPCVFAELIEDLIRFEGKLIIQTLFLRGVYRGEAIDNTTPGEVEAWLGHLRRIKPQMVMIYPIARATPAQNLEKTGTAELEAIAVKVRNQGIKAMVYQ